MLPAINAGKTNYSYEIDPNMALTTRRVVTYFHILVEYPPDWMRAKLSMQPTKMFISTRHVASAECPSLLAFCRGS